MEVIILIALIFVILNLANKYLKVPRDGNQRYDGINNRFYGEGYTGDTPVPPTNDENQESGRGDLQDEQAGEGAEVGDDEIGVDGQAGEDMKFGSEIGVDGQADEQPGYVPADRPEAEAPAGETAIYGNIGNAPGVVIDTEVSIDATMSQDSGKS